MYKTLVYIEFTHDALYHGLSKFRFDSPKIIQLDKIENPPNELFPF